MYDRVNHTVGILSHIVLLYVLFFNVYTKVEADRLKSIIIGGRPTKLVAFGIGNGVNEDELNSTASSPKDKNVIRVPDFKSLTDVKERLGNASCSGLLLLVLSVSQ